MTPELIAILALGATLIGFGATMIGLLLTYRREVRADSQALRAGVRADNQGLGTGVNAGFAGFRADNQRLRTEDSAGFAQVRGDLADVRKDMQALTERVSRIEGAIEGFFAGQGARERQDDAA